MHDKATEQLPMTKYLTTREAAQFLRVTGVTLWRLRKNGLPFHRICSKVLYDVRDLEAFMTKQRRNGEVEK